MGQSYANQMDAPLFRAQLIFVVRHKTFSKQSDLCLQPAWSSARADKPSREPWAGGSGQGEKEKQKPEQS